MGNIASIGRAFFAAALIAFGVQQFLFGDFVPGRAPAWPASMSGRLLWAYASGAAFIAAGATIAFATATRRYQQAGRSAAILSGTLIFAWALVRQIPIAAADPTFGAAWTKLGKALALFGGAFAVAGSLASETPKRSLIYLGRVCLGIFMINSGIQHFLWVPFVTPLVPTWIPGALFWTYFAGVALIAGGAGLIFPPTARVAGTLSGVMVFTWFLILHIPRAIAAPEAQLRNEWTSVFEALAVSGLAFLLSVSESRSARSPAPDHTSVI